MLLSANIKAVREIQIDTAYRRAPTVTVSEYKLPDTNCYTSIQPLSG
jgi:hypothetical protein